MSGISYIKSDHVDETKNKISFLNRYHTYKTNVLKDNESLIIHSSLGTFDPDPSPAESHGIYLFLDGIIFNDDVSQPCKEYCLKKYIENGIDFVKEFNGEFFITIYNSNDDSIIFASDRYNTRLHFIFKNGYNVIVSPDFEFITKFSNTTFTLDPISITEYIQKGYISKFNTFLNEIAIIPPATTVKINGNLYEQKTYWKFSYNEDNTQSEDILVQKLVSTFLTSLRKRVSNKDLSYIIELSGGLDSRAILTGISKIGYPDNIQSITFGSNTCDETTLARKVASILNSHHSTMEITPEMILHASNQICDVSGGLSYLGVGYNVPISEHLSSIGNVMIDGFALDLTLGGNYLIPGTSNDENVFNSKVMFNQVGDLPVRTHIETLHPTTDNEFVDIILSVPQNLRYKHRIYKKFLKSLDERMVKIPYNKTMIPVYYPEILWDLSTKYISIKEFLKNRIRTLSKGKLILHDNRSYVSFHEWFYTNEEWKTFFTTIIKSKSSKFIDQKMIDNILLNYENGNAESLIQCIFLASVVLFIEKHTHLISDHNQIISH